MKKQIKILTKSPFTFKMVIIKIIISINMIF